MIITLLSFIFVLGAAVVIHEFGHYIVAKILGMRVEAFSVGFGPRLIGKKIGDTDYRLSAIPLGGYVKLGGDESNSPIEGDSSSNIPERERFDLRPRWQKFLVIIAGPVMNILTALTVAAAFALLYGVPVAPQPVVTQVTPDGAAQQAGLQVGDRISSFNGVENPSWDRIRNDALIAPEQSLPMTVERNGQRVNLTLKPTKHTEDGESMGLLDFKPQYNGQTVVVSEVLENSPAARAGLAAGDVIFSINGAAILDEEDVKTQIQKVSDAPLRIIVERAGAQREISAQLDDQKKLGILYGARPPIQKVGLGSALSYAVYRNIEILRLTGNALGQVFSGKRSARDTFAGPIGIAKAAGKAANESGWYGVITMLGFLSLNLGVVNLLPIPVLDGGAIALLGIEALLGVFGLGLSMAWRERIQQVGFVMLMLLMVFVIGNDLLKVASSWRSVPSEKPATQQTAPQQR